MEGNIKKTVAINRYLRWREILKSKVEFDVVCFLIPPRVNRGLSDRTILLFRFESVPDRSCTIFKCLYFARLDGCGT